MKIYRKRIADEILKRKLEGKGAVLIEGPKWCGKTTTAEQIAALPAEELGVAVGNVQGLAAAGLVPLRLRDSRR